MRLIRRRLVDEQMTEVLMKFQDTSNYASEFIYDIEKILWDIIEDRLGLNSFRWDFPKHNQWIGWVR